MLAPAQVDEKSHTASFRVSLPLSKLAAGRYAVQALVIAPGTQHSAFGRAYLALEQPAPVPATAPGQQPGAPTGAKSPTR
jgi:hypothetical protein